MPVSPPRPALPPLNALRAFEVAARLGGFLAAAEELGVTPGAVSQQVRILEDWAGVTLFERRSRGVRLTQDGARVAGDMTRAFDELGRAVGALRAGVDAPTITLATLPSIAQLWLPSRLGALRAALGHRQVSVTALEAPPNLLRESYDLSIFFLPSDSGHSIAPDLMFPVCAPALADQIRTPEDLAGMTLLHDASWSGDWRHWAELSRVALPSPHAGPRYSLYALVLAEAKAGAGVAMGHFPLVKDALQDGSLVRPLVQAEAFSHRLYRDGIGTGKRLCVQVSPRFSDTEAEAIQRALA